MINLNKYKGIINFLLNTEDFLKEYSYMSKSLIYESKSELDKTEKEYGIFLSNTNKDKFLKIKIEKNKYLNLYCYYQNKKKSFEKTELINSILNFFEIEIICSFISSIEKFGDCSGELIMVLDDRVMCVEFDLPDIIELSIFQDFPIFIKKSLFDDYGIKKEKIIGL